MPPIAEPPRRVLIVEDDEHIRMLLAFILQRQGYVVDSCSDGRAARSFIEAGTAAPALILLDVMLPYVDGFELMHIIRHKPLWETVPIVMLSAKNTEADIARALSAGANDYVIKPFQPNELMERVRRFARDQP